MYAFVRILLRRGVHDTTLCDKVDLVTCAGWWFPASSINKTDCHDITEILLKVALTTITLTVMYVFSLWLKKISVWCKVSDTICCIITMWR